MKLYIIDGHALVFKMYYAFLGNTIINTKGEDMSVLFGFTKYLLELIDREKPSHIAVCFDPPGGSFRNTLYPDYKANRAETPKTIVDALEPLCKIVSSMDIPILMKQGYEADDVIGSAAVRFAAEGFDVYMVTPDKDFGQLISPTIHQYKPARGKADNEIWGEKEVCDKWGIDRPSQVIDILAICGDISDNVPGVAGVGQKGASGLLKKYDSLEGIYQHINDLTPRQRDLFTAAQDHIALSKELVTIKTDIPLEISSEDLVFNMTKPEKLIALMKEYEFPSLIRLVWKLSKGEGIALPVIANDSEAISPHLIANSNDCGSTLSVIANGTQWSAAIPANLKMDLTSKCDEIATVVNSLAMTNLTDLAMTNLKAIPLSDLATAPRVAINLHENTLYVCSGDKYCKTTIQEAQAILQDPNITKVGYGLKDLLHKTTIQGRLEDIEIIHYLLNPESSHKLESLISSYLGISLDPQTEMASLFDEPEDKGPDKLKESLCLIPLCDRLLLQMNSTETLSQLYNTIEEPLIKVLAKMENTGVKVEMNALQEYAEQLRSEMLAQEQKVRELADEPTLNVSSPKQIGIVVYEKLALDPKAKKPKKGNWPTDEATLSELKDKSPIIDAILEYRGLRKLLSTYIEPFGSYISLRDGRVHTTFNQSLTATGRLSSSNPNLQNIPIRTEQGRLIRKAFVAANPNSVIMSADYSQIELRIMAHLCQDTHLVEAFKAGEDVHKATAAKIYHIDIQDVTSEQRRVAKTANFGIMYGISAFGLAQRLSCTRSEAQQIIADYFDSFPAIRQFIDGAIESAKICGYAETLFGRRRYLPDIQSGNANLRALAERNAVNAPIQGTAADIIKLAMIGVDKRLSTLKSKIVLQIHDELLLEVPNDEIAQVQEILVQEMENVIQLSVPLTVECNYGTNWLEAH